MMRAAKLFGLGVALVMVALAAGNSEPVGLAQAGCTVTVQPGQSIQSAIDEAKEGAVICLAAGTWRENIKITKSLTLRGAGREQTIIKGNREGYPVIWIESDSVIEVKIEGLTAAEAKDADGIVLWDSAQATISNSQVSGNGYAGIWLLGSAQAEIKGSTIEGNGKAEGCQRKDWLCTGISVWHKSQVKLIGSKVLANADWGVWARLKQCGYDEDDFTGQVTFENMKLEDISGNSTTNNQKGMGNPGKHPWNKPGVPDGQVCLP